MAMCCKKWMLKHFVKKRKFYFMAYAVALLAAIVMAVALILDELSGLTDAAYCGCLESAGLAYADCPLDACAEAETAGILWIACGALGIVLCLAAIAMLRLKKTLSFAPYAAAALCWLLAVVLWLADNPLCWAEDGSLGISLILAMVAVVVALIALAIAVYARKK